jgi:AraC-like DNA-binding protein
VTYRSADHGADWLRIGLVLRNVEGRNGPGEICLWRPHCGQWRSDVPVAVTSVRLPRRAVRVADTVLDHWERTALPLSSPAVSVLLQPMLAGLVGRVAALASSPVVADLPDHWTRAITLALRALPVPDSTRDGRPFRVQQLYDLIDAQLGDPKLDAGWLARQMHVSRRSLYLLVPDSDGGVATLIRNRRMQRARDLLRDADHDGRTIAEIGRAVGLPSAAHFTRLFRAAYGITPSAFRAARDDNGRVAGQPESS